MRILYITQTFPPEPGPTARPLGQAQQLQRLGHDVTVLTTLPSAPLGRVFPAYRGRWVVREQVQGVDVLRVRCRPTRNRGYPGRALSWASFAAGASLAGMTLPAPDLVIASVPNLGTELAALLVSWGRGAAFVLELRDLLPDSFALVGVSPDAAASRVVRRWIDAHARRAVAVAVPARGMADALRARLPIAPERVIVLPHAVDDMERRSDPVDLGPRVTLEALYAGSFSAYYDLPNLVACARELARRGAPVRIHLLGSGRERAAIERALAADPCPALVLHPSVAPGDVPRWLAAADVLLSPVVADRHVPYLEGYVTTKLAAYLAAGRPVLAIEQQDVAGGLLARIGAGEAIPSGQPSVLADRLIAWAQDEEGRERMGRAARRWAEENLRREDVVAAFAARLEELLRAR